MMRLNTLWKIDATVDAAGSSPVAERILAGWEHEAGSLRFFRSSANFVYVFRHEGQRRFLRFADSAERSRETIEAEVDLITWLAGAGITVAPPIRAKNGSFVTSTETELGTFHAVVFTELPGAQFEIDELDDSRFRDWGAALGTLHSTVKDYPGQERPGRRTWRNDLELAREYIPTDAPALRTEWNQIAASLGALRMNHDNYGLIHFDFELDNLVWNDHAVGILDFDDCSHYWYAADIALAVRDLFEHGPNLNDTSFRQFVMGYSAHCPLGADTISLIPIFLRLANLLQYARLARSLDLPHDQPYPAWLEALEQKFHDRLATYSMSLEASGL